MRGIVTIELGPIDESMPFAPSAFVTARYARASASVLRSSRNLRLELNDARTGCDGCHLAKTRRGPVKELGPIVAEPLATVVRKFPGFELS
jgi:hypothetical protein